jgi:type 1 glutamine amidotransferase
MKTSVLLIITGIVISTSNLFGQIQSLDPVKLDSVWQQKIYQLAPAQTSVPVSKKHKVLLFSLHTGYEHWVIPHADYVITTLGKKSGAYDVVRSKDVFLFEKNTLNQFDAVVLNNNCSVGPRRDLFYDALDFNSTLSEEDKKQKAAEFEQNLFDFVKSGGGLALVHGGIVMQNNSDEFSDMAGGSFDYHPPQQEIELKVVEKNHPLTLAFDGRSFTHVDEPYFFKNAYAKKNFRPMLYMEVSEIEKMRHETKDKVSYVSWIKKYGDGRVFYCSPSHNAQSYENERMLRYYLNGMQYVLGDLNCDDAPINP